MAPNKIQPPSLLQSTVSADHDYLLPFREHGPSRIRSRAPGGSFDPALSATRAGLFSGLIFRGVIFATEFSRKADAQTFFSSPAEWTAECAKYPDASGEFYCNLRAYGGSKSNRGVHLVQEYWTALTTDDVPNWEKNTENKTYNFMECYKFLKHDNPNRFAEIGALIGFLLAADFAYTGIVTFPDEPTVATIMHEINAGGVKGLELMGLINPRASGNGRKKKAPLAEVKSGFGSLYNFLDCKLSAESKRRMVFDAFMVEYSLMQEHACCTAQTSSYTTGFNYTRQVDKLNGEQLTREYHISIQEYRERRRACRTFENLVRIQLKETGLICAASATCSGRMEKPPAKEGIICLAKIMLERPADLHTVALKQTLLVGCSVGRSKNTCDVIVGAAVLIKEIGGDVARDGTGSWSGAKAARVTGVMVDGE
ncbi:hypothetical protein C8J57DRAFT_1249008 [Mycena rebaudengoi]|nr:hypothetical protein C8J57DRAFT_1249008 [Mycena rebaudengoi]